MSKQASHLVVEWSAIREALHALSVAARDSGDRDIGAEDEGDVRVSFRDGEMVLSRGDNRQRLAAHGHWPGEARCPLPTLMTLIDAELAMGETLHMEHRGARLHVGGRSVASPWRDASLPPVSVPRDTLLPYLPQLRNRGVESLEAAASVDGETERLASATRILAPLGITQRDLERLVAANKARETGELDLI
jgi:hypothetical protein